MTITIADGRGALWQWDTGRRVKITDGDGVKQIHYQNKCFGRSVDVDVGDDGTAIIPDELLQDWHPLTAYAYAADDAGGYTKVQVDFVVHKRARPSDYVYTPTDQMTLQMIQRQIGDLADLTTEAKDTLVAAINEAAASESMSLRVADGYIQYSTDSGSTWTNLIAMADLKGAGMDITGATVGQIAKITAVDDSGKPTAWEPVDMPSGGGGGGGVQPDWNQNDETAADYVKNRPGGFKVPTGMVINFDGNTAGLETKTDEWGITYYKISNQNPYKEQFVDANVVVGGKTPDKVLLFDDQNGYTLQVEVELADSGFCVFSLMCDGATGLWFTFEDISVVAFSVTQTNSGYVKLPADAIGGGIPHSNLLSLGSYDVNVSSFTSDDVDNIRSAIQSGDYSQVFLYKQFSDYSKYGTSIQIDANSIFEDIYTHDSTIFELYGVYKVAVWEEGDEFANIYDRYIRYYDPQKTVPIKSSTSGSNKVFNITVDDSGTLKATEVTTS